MATLHGAPLPEDFEDGKELTAAAFNAVKDYWVVDELPDTAVDGDVVFVIGDSPVGGSGELPGVGGWADVTAVTGTGTKYEYTANGQDWSAFEWTADGSVTTSEGLLDALLVSGGMGYMTNLSNSGGGGSIVTNIVEITGDSHAIEIGVGKPAGNNFEQYTGTPTSVGTIHTGYAYGAGFSYYGTTTDNVPERGEPYPSSITGSPETYAGGKKNSTTRLGDGGANAGNSGKNGVAIIRVPRSNDKTGLPAGAFDATTLRDKVAAAASRRNNKGTV